MAKSIDAANYFVRNRLRSHFDQKCILYVGAMGHRSKAIFVLKLMSIKLTDQNTI